MDGLLRLFGFGWGAQAEHAEDDESEYSGEEGMSLWVLRCFFGNRNIAFSNLTTLCPAPAQIGDFSLTKLL